MGNDALIGYTGFVGSTLLRDRPFAGTFNSRNIEQIRGKRFDRLVCAGVSAVKWLANKEPEQDWNGIQRLIGCLQDVHADTFVLVSTIDVYRETAGLSEADPPPKDGLHPYGLHRLMLEEFVAQRFPRPVVVRLPALFGAGLKKNVIYDFLHHNQTEKIVPNAVFQWYPTRRLSADLDHIEAAGLNLINVTTEPIATSAIHERFFPEVPIGAAVPTPPLYDLRSIHDALLGGRGGYHLSAEEVIRELESYFVEAKAEG